jgi:hypothetical protein
METQNPVTNPFQASGLFQSTTDVWTPFKLSLEGWAGGGKTLTLGLIILGIWIEEQKKKTVVLQDTDHSAKFMVPLFKHYGLIEGKNFFVTESRSLIDYQNILGLCEKEHAIFMIDTVTHIHAEMLAEFSAEKKRPVQYPGDAFVLKPEWAKRFTEPFVEAKNTHILFTGRAAWEYGMQINEETHKKEFGPTGVKMRGDNELAYEPDVVILMERLQDIGESVRTYRRASILKDRSRQIDGKFFDFWPQEGDKAHWDYEPVWKVFRPVYKFLVAGNPPDQKITPQQTPMGPLFAAGNAELFWERRRQVDVLLEEIDGVYNQWIPGSKGLDKQLRTIIWSTVFNTRSKSALAERTPGELKAGLDAVEHLARFVASKHDELGQMYDSGDYAGMTQLLIGEKNRYDKGPAPEKPPADDDVPDFLTGAERPAVSEIAAAAAQAAQKFTADPVTAIAELVAIAKSDAEIAQVEEGFRPQISKLEQQLRASIEAIVQKRRNELVVIDGGKSKKAAVRLSRRAKNNVEQPPADA